jgi:PhzF family phenazine biosynthesis protein
MTSLPFFQVDAFAAQPFEGNPAAVIPLDAWLPDDVMLRIAAENNLSETAFTVPSHREDADYDLRWFTPTVEVRLCGHATLATAHVLPFEGQVRFATLSGILTVERRNGKLWIDFPASKLTPAPIGDEPGALGAEILGVWSVKGGNDGAIALVDSEATLRALTLDFGRIARCHNGMIMATAPGDTQDFVSRVFCPTFGIDEDPVTGSAHCALVPFWADRLGKTRLSAFQASKRGGHLDCALNGDRVLLGGTGVTTVEGTFLL